MKYYTLLYFLLFFHLLFIYLLFCFPLMQEPRLNAAKILIADQDRKNLSHHPAKKRRGTFLFPEPTGPHPQRRKNHDSSSASSCVTTTKKFTFEELQRLLFTKNDIQEISVKRPVESRQNECFCEYIIETFRFQDEDDFEYEI